MDETLSVPGLLLSLIARYIQQQDIHDQQIESILQKYKKEARVPMQVWWDLLETLHKIHSVPVLGHYLGDLVEPYHINVLGYLALSSPNLYCFSYCFKNFQPILQNSAKFSIYIKNSTFAMTWTPIVQKSTQLSNEILISGTLSIIRKILHRQDIKPLKIEFSASSPQNILEYKNVYQCPVDFGADALRLWLPIDILYLPIPSNDPHLKSLLDQQAYTLLKALPNPDSFLKGLQEAIVSSLRTGEPTADNIADQLNISLRTFYRKLNSYGLQYSELIKIIRIELARNYLNETQLSLTEIALLLGYAEQSAFSRAFKQWENMTPSNYRNLKNKVS